MEPRSQHQDPKTQVAVGVENALRCGCGNLLARVVAEGVEIKCRRCKRRVIVPRDAKGTIRLSM